MHYRTTDPVDKAWVEGDSLHVLIDGDGPASGRTRQIVRDVHSKAPDLLRDALFEHHDNGQHLVLHLVTAQNAAQALTTFLVLWQAVTGRLARSVSAPTAE